MNVKNILSHVHITTGEGKMKNIPSINVSSLSNSFCKLMSANKKSVCGKCYSNRYSKMRPLLEKKLLDNSELLSLNILSEEEVPSLNSRFVRFNSFGEIINDIHYQNLIKIAKKNPFTTFGLWTKRSDIVMKYPKEPNIKYIYSVSMINGKKPPENVMEWFDKVFIVHKKDTKEEINCHGACINCLICYTNNPVKIINEKVK